MLMQAGLSESLAGRFQRIPVTHWSFAEMSAAFGVSLSEYLYYGGYPRGAAIRRHADQWRDHVLHAIVEPHLDRDLLSIAYFGEVEHAFRGCGTRIPAKWNARRSAATLSGRSLPFGSRWAPEILPVPP